MILIVDMNWKADSLGYYEFVLPIARVLGPLDDWIAKHYLEITSRDLFQCDSVILSGTALKDVATLSQIEQFQWLKDTEKPVLGICAGMETIGKVYGARLGKSLEIGMTQIHVLKENPFFNSDFKAYSLHSVGVEPTDDFEVWAESEKCAQVIKHKTNPTYGFLFHPEVRNPELIHRFVKLTKR